MKRKWNFWLFLLLFALLTGCGQQNSGAESEESEAEGVESTLEQLAGDQYRYTLKNNTEEPLSYEFTSGQRYDYVLKTAEGEIVHQFSSVSTFIQALGEESVAPGEKLTYEFEIPPLNLSNGTYTIEAWLTPKKGEAHPAAADYSVN